MSYIDGFLIPVPASKQEDYRKLAELAAPVFIEHGAIEVVECWGDDLIRGEATDFYMAVKAEPDEGVVFSWIKWPDKAARDAGNKAAMADKRFEHMDPLAIFDGKRMIFSGFAPMVEHKSEE